MFSLKNKKQNGVVFALALLLFSTGVFLFAPLLVHAQEASEPSTFGSMISGALDSTVGLALRGLLYAIFVLLGWFTSTAVTIFEWAINPDYISGRSGLLNKASIYANWKFVRDFFNLFFILTLLYTAFTIVFQVAKDYKKTLLSLVLAALFVNFSFPITRVIIDITNVPMYYFVNQIAAKQEGKSAFGNFLGASKIQDALIPESYSVMTGSTSQLLVAIIMLFLFMISMLTLSVLMIIRLVALVILLIFSSVGFAASVIPGLGKYGSQWWDKLAQYALFGPASMLMLLIATRFFAEIGVDATGGQFGQVALKNATSADSKLIASMAMFSVPVIMMWFAIGLGSSMSLIGAGAVVGQAQKFSKWAGKKVTYNNALGHGLKKTAMEGKFLGGNYGKTTLGQFATGNFWKEPGKVGAAVTGYVTGRSAGAKTEIAKLHAQQVNKAVKENKENQVNRSNLLRDLESGDTVERQAAALTLAENGEIRSADDLTKALKALRTGLMEDGVTPHYDEAAVDMAARIIDKSKDGATSGLSPKVYADIASSDDFYVKDNENKVVWKNKDGATVPIGTEGAKPVVGAALDGLNSKLKKDGQINVRIGYEMGQMKENTPESRKAVYDELIGKMSAEDLAKQKKIYDEDSFKEYAQGMNKKRLGQVLEKATEKSDAAIQAGWSGILAGTSAKPDPIKEKAVETKELRDKLKQKHGKA